jgi:AcrR family transcriptional regulator
MAKGHNMNESQLMKLSEIQKQEKKDEILKAARQLFAKKGMDSTSVQEIAKKAGVAKGTVYLYYESKNQIFMEIIRFARNILHKKTKETASEPGKVIPKIRKLIQIHQEFTKKYPEYNAIFAQVSTQMMSLENDVTQLFLPESEEENPLYIVFNLLKEGVDNGELKPDINLYEETFRLWFLTMGMSTVSNMLRNTSLPTVWFLKDKVDEEKVLWDTMNQFLNKISKE